MATIINPERLAETLLFTNKEIIGNISRLGKVVQDYEGIQGWNDARKRASEISRSGKVNVYLNDVRKAFMKANPDADLPQFPLEKDEPVRRAAVYEKNYDKLMELVPGLEAKLLDYQGESIHGKSIRTGHMDFVLELISLDQNGFFFTLTRFVSKDGKRQPHEEMEVYINTNKQKVEALSFEDTEKQIQVYDDKFNRKEILNKSQKKQQNDLLTKWLKDLKSEGHKVKWTEPDTTGIAPSGIIDKYQKKTEQEIPKEDEKPKEQPSEKPKEEPSLAKIISLSSGLSESDHKELVNRFVRLVSTNENVDGVKVMKILQRLAENGETMLYFLSAWEKMKQRDYDHLTALNYLRLDALVPNLLETLKKEGGTIRLVSDHSKTVFRLQLGDDRKANETVVGIYQQNGKTPEPTVLIRVHIDKKSISTDLSTGSFSSSADFNAAKKDPHSEGTYNASIAFERWMKYLDLKGFKPVLVQMKKVEDQTQAAEEPDEYDEHYINKDIPDFEPGKVKLTEAHKKRGVTQEIIDRINNTGEGVTLFPRTKPMILNTRKMASDKAIQAKKPGFRLSATGKFYYEGRSNRSDRTRKGY